MQIITKIKLKNQKNTIEFNYVYDKKKYKTQNNFLVDFPILLSAEQADILNIEDEKRFQIEYEFLQEDKKWNLKLNKSVWLPKWYFFIEWRNLEIIINDKKYNLFISRKEWKFWKLDLDYLDDFWISLNIFSSKFDKKKLENFINVLKNSPVNFIKNQLEWEKWILKLIKVEKKTNKNELKWKIFEVVKDLTQHLEPKISINKNFYTKQTKLTTDYFTDDYILFYKLLKKLDFKELKYEVKDLEEKFWEKLEEIDYIQIDSLQANNQELEYFKKLTQKYLAKDSIFEDKLFKLSSEWIEKKFAKINTLFELFVVESLRQKLIWDDFEEQWQTIIWNWVKIYYEPTIPFENLSFWNHNFKILHKTLNKPEQLTPDIVIEKDWKIYICDVKFSAFYDYLNDLEIPNFEHIIELQKYKKILKNNKYLNTEIFLFFAWDNQNKEKFKTLQKEINRIYGIKLVDLSFFEFWRFVNIGIWS